MGIDRRPTVEVPKVASPEENQVQDQIASPQEPIAVELTKTTTTVDLELEHQQNSIAQSVS